MGHKIPDDLQPQDHWLHLWAWFFDLTSCRSMGMNGPNPLSLQDISLWIEFTGAMPTREEVSILREMDATFLNALAQERAAQEARNKKEAT